MNKDRFVYVPNRLEGKCLFNGKANPSEAVLKVIGNKGIREIKKNLTEIIEFRKGYRGRQKLDHYALYYLQNFFDLQKRVFVKVEQAIDNESHKTKQDYTLTLRSMSPQLKHWHQGSNRALYGIINRGQILSDETWHPSKEENYWLGTDRLHPDFEFRVKNM